MDAGLPLLASNQSSRFVFMENIAAGYQAYIDVVEADASLPLEREGGGSHPMQSSRIGGGITQRSWDSRCDE
jgi:hypothetical protein